MLEGPLSLIPETQGQGLMCCKFGDTPRSMLEGISSLTKVRNGKG
jgi:hypothetical protein